MAENDASFGSKLTTDTPDFDSVINILPMNILRLESGFSRDPEEPAPVSPLRRSGSPPLFRI